MSDLKYLLAVLHASVEVSSADEIKRACELIIRAQRMTAAERDTLRHSFEHGPSWDGDVPSKQARTQLADEGFMCRVVVKGEEGFNACTYKGARLYRLLNAGTIMSTQQRITGAPLPEPPK